MLKNIYANIIAKFIETRVIIIATVPERLTCFFDSINCEVRHRKSPKNIGTADIGDVGYAAGEIPVQGGRNSWLERGTADEIPRARRNGWVQPLRYSALCTLNDTPPAGAAHE